MRRIKRDIQSSVTTGSLVWVISISVFLSGALSAELFPSGKVLGSESCSTSGCHGGAGPNRGAYTIWRNYDPHTASAATLKTRRSDAMAEMLGIDDPTESSSCTVCHAPNRQVDPSMFADPDLLSKSPLDNNTVSCANCHGGAKDWILSHTRDGYPKDALEHLGMRQLGTAYERANSCVACHQNVSDKLILAKHPKLIFELDGMLEAEGKHWREEKDFSHAQTWLVGQAVALREVAALSVSEAAIESGNIIESEARVEQAKRRTAEIAALKELLRVSGKTLVQEGEALVKEADDYAKLASSTPITQGRTKEILVALLGHDAPFNANAFDSLPSESVTWAAGFYAERLVLAIDRLNESLVKSGEKAAIAEKPLIELFNAAKPPIAFDSVASDVFKGKLKVVSESYSGNR